MKKHITVLLLLLFAGATTVFAQSQPSRPPVWSGFGAHVGGNASLLRGNDVGITDNATDRSLGFTIGVYRAIPLGAGFALQPEVMYAQKGGELSFEQPANGGTTESELVFNLDYVEVPVALMYAVPTQSRYVPMLYAGPYVSLATRRNATFEVDEGSLSVDADDVFRQFDYGAAFGADLGIQLKKRMATIGVRYDLGIADIVKNDEEVGDVEVQNEARNDEWSILIGFRL